MITEEQFLRIEQIRKEYREKMMAVYLECHDLISFGMFACIVTDEEYSNLRVGQTLVFREPMAAVYSCAQLSSEAIIHMRQKDAPDVQSMARPAKNSKLN